MKESIPKCFKRLRYGLAFLSIAGMFAYHTNSQIKKSRQDLYGLHTTFELPDHPNKNSPAQKEYFQFQSKYIASQLNLPSNEKLPSLFTHVLFSKGATYRQLQKLNNESRTQFYEIRDPHKLYAIAGYIDYFSKQENCNTVGQYISDDRLQKASELGGLVTSLAGQLNFEEIPARPFSSHELLTIQLMDPFFNPDDTYLAPESSANKLRIGTWHIHLDGSDHASSSGTDIENILRQSEHQIHAVISDVTQNQFNVNLFFYSITNSGLKVMDIDIGNYRYVSTLTP